MEFLNSTLKLNATTSPTADPNIVMVYGMFCYMFCQ